MCCECFKTAVPVDNLLNVVGVLRLHFRGQFWGVVGVLRLHFPRTINFVACCECFKTAVSADNSLSVVSILRLQFPRTIC